MQLSLTKVSEQDNTERYIVTVEDDDADAATVLLTIDATDASLTVEEVTVRKQKGLMSRDIRIPLGRYLAELGDMVGRLMGDTAVGAELMRSRVSPQVGRLASAGESRRRLLTDDFLSDVAEAYTAAGDNISGLVGARFSATDSTKFRWVKAARERGMLAERDA